MPRRRLAILLALLFVLSATWGCGSVQPATSPPTYGSGSTRGFQ